jgi:hypothetical protein
MFSLRQVLMHQMAGKPEVCIIIALHVYSSLADKFELQALR